MWVFLSFFDERKSFKLFFKLAYLLNVMFSLMPIPIPITKLVAKKSCKFDNFIIRWNKLWLGTRNLAWKRLLNYSNTRRIQILHKSNHISVSSWEMFGFQMSFDLWNSSTGLETLFVPPTLKPSPKMHRQSL